MRPHPRRAQTDPTSPRAWATSDRTGWIGNHCNMQFQYQWGGTRLYNTGVLVNPDELDVPQPQLKAIILPPDPPSIRNARVEQYAIDEQPVSTRYTMDGRVRVVSYTPYPVERIVTVPGNLDLTISS